MTGGAKGVYFKYFIFLIVQTILISCNSGSESNDGSEAEVKQTFGVERTNSRVDDLSSEIKNTMVTQSKIVLADLGLDRIGLSLEPDLIVGAPEVVNVGSSESFNTSQELFYDASGSLVGSGPNFKDGHSWAYTEKRIDVYLEGFLRSKHGEEIVFFPESRKNPSSKDVLSFFLVEHSVKDKMAFKTDAKLGDSFVMAMSVAKETEISKGGQFKIFPPELLTKEGYYSKYQESVLSAVKKLCEQEKSNDNPSFENFDCKKADVSNCGKCGNYYEYSSFDQIINKLKDAQVPVQDIACIKNDCSWLTTDSRKTVVGSKSEGPDIRQGQQCELFAREKVIDSAARPYTVTSNKVLFTFEDEADKIKNANQLYIYRKLPNKDCVYRIGVNGVFHDKEKVKEEFYGGGNPKIDCIKLKTGGKCHFISLEVGVSISQDGINCDNSTFWVTENYKYDENLSRQTGFPKCNLIDHIFN